VRGFAVLAALLLVSCGFLALVSVTDRIDRHWSRNRTVRHEPVVLRQMPPFIYADTQCRQCGVDGEPLSLGEKLCLYCHEVKHG
jgi:hypothetical protein